MSSTDIKLHRVFFGMCFFLAVTCALTAVFVTLGPELLMKNMGEHIYSMITVPKEGTPEFEIWATTGSKRSEATLVEYYVSHITNLDGVLSNRDTPIVLEKGPYVFKKYTSNSPLPHCTLG
jgi:hypothetical protein